MSEGSAKEDRPAVPLLADKESFHHWKKIFYLPASVELGGQLLKKSGKGFFGKNGIRVIERRPPICNR